MPSRSYFLRDRNDPHLMAYQNYFSAIAKMLATEKGLTFTEQDVVDMVDFEIQLANVSTHIFNCEEFGHMYPSVC